MHEDYNGDVNKQASDLAIVVLRKPLVFSNSIGAVCYDLADDDFDEEQLTPGKIGKVNRVNLLKIGKVSRG